MGKVDINGRNISKHEHANSPPCHMLQRGVVEGWRGKGNRKGKGREGRIGRRKWVQTLGGFKVNK